MGKRKKQYDYDAVMSDPDAYGRPLTEAELDDLHDVELDDLAADLSDLPVDDLDKLAGDLSDLPVDDLDKLAGDLSDLDAGDLDDLDTLDTLGNFDDFLAANAY